MRLTIKTMYRPIKKIILVLIVFAMILPAGGLFAELPPQESKWPLMPVFVGD